MERQVHPSLEADSPVPVSQVQRETLEMTKSFGEQPPAEAGKNLLEKALRLLRARDYAEAEMKQRLLMAGGDETEICAIVARLKEVGYLNDARLAERKAEEARTHRLVGKRRVERELLARQMEGPQVRRAVEAAFDGTSEDELALQHLQQRLQAYLIGQRLEDPKELRRAYGKLRRAGFAHGSSVRALQAHSKLADSMDESDTGTDDSP